MKKIVLVFGATYNQLPLIKAIHDMGHEAWATAAGDVSICENIAEKVLNIDTSDKEQLLDIVKKNKISGMVTCGTSTPIITIAYINEQLGLSNKSISFQTALNATIKNRYQALLAPLNIVPKGSSATTIEHTIEIAKSISFPIIIKPVDGGGGKGVEVIRTDNLHEIHRAFNRSIGYSKSKKVIVEEYIEGVTFGVESITLNGKTTTLAIPEKTIAGRRNFVTTGLFFPSEQLMKHQKEIVRVNQKAIEALGILWGATHIDMMLTAEGKVYIIDIGPRLAGGPVAATLIPQATGYNFYKAIIELSMDIMPETPQPQQPLHVFGSHFVTKPQKGRIVKISYPSHLPHELNIHNLRILKNVGDTINNITSDSDRLAVFHFRADDKKDMERIITSFDTHFQLETTDNA